MTIIMVHVVTWNSLRGRDPRFSFWPPRLILISDCTVSEANILIVSCN